MDDPFEMLGLPGVFDLEAARIERAYLGRAAALHPDVVGESEDAAVRSAALNRAKAVLLDPESRGNALLRRLGGPAKEQDKSLPVGFLMEMMQTREEIDRAIGTGNEGERRRWQAWACQQRELYAQRVAGIFQRIEAGQAAAVREAREQLNAWRYIERLIQQLDPQYRYGDEVVG